MFQRSFIESRIQYEQDVYETSRWRINHGARRVARAYPHVESNQTHLRVSVLNSRQQGIALAPIGDEILVVSLPSLRGIEHGSVDVLNP